MTHSGEKSAAKGQAQSLPFRHGRKPVGSEPEPKSKLVFQLRTELHRLQTRDREWKSLFQILAHDLKEPLVTIEGFLKLLSETDPLHKEQKRYLKVLEEATNSLHLLVGSLQSVARLSQSAQENVEVSLAQVLESVKASLAEQLQKAKATLILPERDLSLKTDPVRLYQILLNLIANSLKYHRPDVPPVIKVRTRRDAQQIKISIEDNGRGIDRKDAERIFAPFVRLEDGSQEGLGLGLSIVKRLAESLGGRISLRSRQNVGSTFVLCLQGPKS